MAARHDGIICAMGLREDGSDRPGRARKQALTEDPVLRDENDLRRAVDTTPALIHTARPDGYIDFLNQGWLDFAGIRSEDLQGWGWVNTFHPDDVEACVGKWRDALASGEPFEGEGRVRRADGEYRTLLHRKVPLRGEHGSIVKWYGSSIDIEDLKRARAELQESEERFRRMADVMPEVIWITALNPERVLYASPSFERMWGLPVSDLYQNPRLWTDTIHPEDRTRVVETFTRWIVGDKVSYRDVEYRIIQPQGATRWIHERGVLSLNEKGKPYLASGIASDITARKHAEQELQRSEAYLEEAQRLSLTGSFGWKVSTGKLVWSDETFRILGYDRSAEPTFDLVFNRVHPDDAAVVHNSLNNAARDGTKLNFEHRLQMPDGSIKHVHVVAHALANGPGEVEFVGAVMDVTNHKSSQQALERAFQQTQTLKDQFERAIDTIPGLVWSALPDGQIDFLNQRWLEYTGLSLEEAEGWGWQVAIHPQDVGGLVDYWKSVLTSGKPGETMARLRRVDGAYRWFLFRGVPLYDGTGELIKWYGQTTDIDDRKRAEDDLQQALDEIKKLKDQLYKENIALRDEIDKTSMFEEIVGGSPALQSVLAVVAKVAPTDSTVLITGETGTGKELIARAVHKRSPRSSRAFVTVNCAAIPVSLIASELFGHEKGAFTGALQRRLGRFELADGGTIFLDEVGELPAETQIALLRVLQEREFERVGGNRPIHTDVRVIGATNRDLQRSMATGAFRTDLYYRLNVCPIEIPPLREREKDIPMLVEYFIDRYARKAGKKIRTIEDQTLKMLQSYSWPGNIRELQNVIERAVVFCETENFSVDRSWLCQSLTPQAENRLFVRKSAAQEKQMIEAALAQTGGRISGPSGAASQLGLPPSTLDSKIRSLKINKYLFKQS
jgi:PAS domain S-box-containing protein